MPSARTASALRRLVSAMTWRSATLLVRSDIGPRLLRLGQKRQGDDDDAAEDREPAEPGMDDEAADEEDRHERHVEQSRRAHAGEKAADLVEIADRLQAVGLLGALERHRRHEVEDAAARGFRRSARRSGPASSAAERIEARPEGCRRRRTISEMPIRVGMLRLDSTRS